MATTAELAQQIAAYDANRKSSADILNEALNKYGVPEIRTRVSGIRTTLANTEAALNNVDPSVTGRTSQSLVTEAQRQRIVNNERAPIAQDYSTQSKTLSNESANLSDQEKAAQLLAQGQMNDYTVGRNALQSQYDSAAAREAEERRRAEADRAYQLDVQKSASSSRSGGGGGGGGSSAPSYQKRSGGGFNFQDANGKAISAGSYARITGTSWKGLLQSMANNGDAGAKDVLKNGSKSKYWTAFTWGS